MTDFRRDTVYGKDGRFHDVRLVPGDTDLKYDNGSVFVVSRPMIGCRLAVDATGVPWVIAPSWGDQILINLNTGKELVFSQFGGYYGIAALRQLDQDCEVYLRGPHDGAGGCLIHVFDIHGTEVRTQAALYSANGILYVFEDGRVQMVDQPPIATIGGVDYRYAMESNGWWAGQLQLALPEGSLGVVKPDGSQWVTWPDLNNQQPSYLAAHGDQFRLAIQGVNTPEPSQVVLTRRPGDGPVVPPVEPPVTPGPCPELTPSKVAARPMFYANGDMKLTLRVPKGGIATPKVGATIQIVK